MAIDPGIPLSVRPPDLMTPGQALSLQSIVQNMQMNRFAQQQQQVAMQKLNAITSAMSAPDAIDPSTGQPRPETYTNLYKIDPQFAQKIAQTAQQSQMNLLNQQNIQQMIDERRDKERQRGEDLVTDVANVVVSQTMDTAKTPNADHNFVDQQAKENWQKEWKRRADSGLITPHQYEAAIKNVPTWDWMQARTTTPKEKAESERKEKAESETPFMKELIARGVKPGSPEWNKELKEHAKKSEGLQINLGPALSEGGLASAASQAATGQPLTQVVPGYGNAAAVKREQVREAAVKQIMAQNPGMSERDAGVELASRATGYIAGRKSVGQLTTMLGATKQAVSQLEFNINKTKEALQSMPGSNLSPIINAIVRGEQRWTGDPRYSQLFYFMHATAMESARILQGGQASIAQLHQGAADEAKKWADANLTTPKAFIEGAAPAMIDEGRYRLKSYEDAIRSQSPLGGAMPPPPSPAQEGRPGAGGRAFDPSILPPDKAKLYQQNAKQLEDIRRQLDLIKQGKQGEQSVPGFDDATYEPAPK